MRALLLSGHDESVPPDAAGRRGFLAGRIGRSAQANPSSPTTGISRRS